jgi:Kef-type K+ transport system membrane component KefB
VDTSAQLLLTLGGILLLGLVTSTIGRRTALPRVTMLLLFGMLIGEQGLDLMPREFVTWFDDVATVALVMVGFLLGGQLTRQTLHSSMRQVLWISAAAAIAVVFFVFAGLVLVGVPVPLAIIVSCIASATAPAAVLDVVSEARIKNRFTGLLLAIVAIDDIWALALFSLGMAVVTSMNGAGSESSFMLVAGWEIGGALLLGMVIGFPAAFLTGRVKPGQPILSEALGLVFLCGGLALWMEVSYLIAAMTMGLIVANFARHHNHPFHAIENVEQPLMVIFFILAGASFELAALRDLGILGAVYVSCRAMGKVIGAYVGGRLSDAGDDVKRWMGLALMPQAGVPIGMALVASNLFPEYRAILLSLVISTTVVFELLGPVLTRQAVNHSTS